MSKDFVKNKITVQRWSPQTRVRLQYCPVTLKSAMPWRVTSTNTTYKKGLQIYLKIPGRHGLIDAYRNLAGLKHIRMLELDKIYLGDCLELMKEIPDGTVDCVICDLPYGTTENKWDNIIPFDELWEAYRRVCKQNAAICLFAQQPFAANLIMSNVAWFRYEWIWVKYQGTGFLNANKMPMKAHENILVFYKSLPLYNPQKIKIKARDIGRIRYSSVKSKNYGNFCKTPNVEDGTRFPTDVLTGFYDKERMNSSVIDKGLHPTQKPVDLVRYLVETYTNEGDLVLDNCMGSGTTAIACHRSHRHFIGMEMNEEFYRKACERLDNERKQLTLF